MCFGCVFVDCVGDVGWFAIVLVQFCFGIVFFFAGLGGLVE